VDHLPRGRPFLRLAALLHGVAPRRVAALLVRLRLSNAQTDAAARRAGAPPLPPPEASDAELRRWLSAVGRAHWRAVVRVEMARARVDGRGAEVVESWRRLRSVLRTGPALEVGELALDGRDLIRLGLRPGPRFGEILERLLEEVVEDPARNEAGTLRARALQLAQEAGDV